MLKQTISFFLCLQQIPDSYSADGCCSCGHVFTEKKLIGGKRFSGKCNMHLSTKGKVISVDVDTYLTRCTYPGGDSCFHIYQMDKNGEVRFGDGISFPSNPPLAI